MPPFFETIQQALALDPRIFAQITQAQQGLLIAISVVALAGLSDALAQSLILFINRISPQRFGLAILLSAGTHIVGYLFWTATIWLVGVYLFNREITYTIVGRAVGLAYAPQLLGFFVLTPYLGSLFALIISVWSLLATVIAVQVGLNLTIWQAVACSGLGWLLVQIWRRTLGRPLLRFEHWLRRRTAGVPMLWTLHDLSQLRLPERLRHRIQLRSRYLKSRSRSQEEKKSDD
ncbi:MAG: YIP1 family protein [Caldilineaceae bacterium]|nr:YIP1 family protein [Caldilineaceae bacterium]